MLKVQPKIEVDELFKLEVLRLLRAKYEEERVGIHATDLLWPRQTVFRKIKGSRVSEKDVIFYVLGTGEGEVAEELMGGKHEVMVVRNGVIHTIDTLIHENGGMVPIEIKTTRSSPPSVRKHYLLQLGMYCTALDVNYGRLIILYLNSGTIEAYKIEYPPEIRAEIDRFEVEKRAEIEGAVRSGNPLDASCVAGDPDLDWKCLACEYWPECCGRTTSFRIDFPEPLIPGGPYEATILRETLTASDFNCNVKVLRNKADEVVGVEASGDEVKLVPLRRAAEEIKARMGHKNAEGLEVQA